MAIRKKFNGSRFLYYTRVIQADLLGEELEMLAFEMTGSNFS